MKCEIEPELNTMKMENRPVIGYWLSEKKKQKINWNDFHSICAENGFILKQLDLNMSLETQGPFTVLIHKLTDTLARAESDDQNAKAIVARVQGYIRRHPEIIMMDPLDNIRLLRNRHNYYEILRKEMQYNDIFVPNSVEFRYSNSTENLKQMRQSGINFPFICKPLKSHGSSNAHSMMLIFNEKGMTDCQPPCVAQDFINHNAILYKVYIVGSYFHIVERPSLKNFYPNDCEKLNTIFFSSHDISKSDSHSQWTVISDEDKTLSVKPNFDVFEEIVNKVTKLFGLMLVGVDVVIENHSGRYAIIDVNVFPGYDGYPHFLIHLIETIKLMIGKHKATQFCHSIIEKCLSDDLDSGFESDERKKTVDELNGDKIGVI